MIHRIQAWLQRYLEEFNLWDILSITTFYRVVQRVDVEPDDLHAILYQLARTSSRGRACALPSPHDRFYNICVYSRVRVQAKLVEAHAAGGFSRSLSSPFHAPRAEPASSRTILWQLAAGFQPAATQARPWPQGACRFYNIYVHPGRRRC
ncbi:MAG: hypothetical protein GXO54_06125 [Chloroflexi bacterium]|nr:hypothetical protein [Chloroflexota bacterium]